jgi:hypothetical protein
MQTYKFKTIISEEGVISLPEEIFLFGKQVEITIKPIIESKPDKKYFVEQFIKEWSGILKDVDFDAIDDSDDPKFQYLKEKYLCNK